MKTLVAYFSKSGKTAAVASELAKLLEADLFEIKTEKEYPKSYIKTVKAGRDEMNSGERPALVGSVSDFAQYDRVLIGYPVWFGTCPMAVVSFIEQYDWEGKEVYPFCTSTSTGIKRSEADIAKYTGVGIHMGLRIKNVNKDEILNWVR